MEKSRFTRVKVFPGYRWPTKEMPVHMLRAAQLRDEQTGLYWLQMKWENASGMVIDYMKIRVECLIGDTDEENGAMVLEELNFEYTDQSVQPDMTFGEKVPLRLPWSHVASVMAKPVEIAFHNGQTWHVGSGWMENYRPKPAQEPAAEKPRQTQTPAGRQDAADAADKAKKADAKPQKLEAAEDEMQLERRARRSGTRWAIRGIGVGLIVVCAVGYVFVARPYLKYVEAQKMVGRGEYEEAISAFETLGDYKDSAAWIAKAAEAILSERYDTATIQFQAGNYEAAQQGYETLGDYLDSEQKAEQAKAALWQQKYDSAMTLYQAGRYEAAKQALEALGGYSDSEEKIRLCEEAMNEAAYQAARQLFSTGAYGDAYAAFTELGTYRDSEYLAKASLNLSGSQTLEAAAATLPLLSVQTQEVIGTVVCTSDSLSNLRNGPSTDYDVVGNAVKGDTFACLGESADGGWYALRMSDGTTAYLSKKRGRFVEETVAAASAQTSAALPAAEPAPVPTNTPEPAFAADTMPPAAAAQTPLGVITITSADGAPVRVSDQ
ncbi:MAG: SH3 domain-containing protein, partial [Clostridia bacterium]|nr:SH3 domain-containing protein [Clostridia bacterium]